MSAEERRKRLEAEAHRWIVREGVFDGKPDLMHSLVSLLEREIDAAVEQAERRAKSGCGTAQLADQPDNHAGQAALDETLAEPQPSGQEPGKCFVCGKPAVRYKQFWELWCAECTKPAPPAPPAEEPKEAPHDEGCICPKCETHPFGNVPSDQPLMDEVGHWFMHSGLKWDQTHVRSLYSWASFLLTVRMEQEREAWTPPATRPHVCTYQCADHDCENVVGPAPPPPVEPHVAGCKCPGPHGYVYPVEPQGPRFTCKARASAADPPQDCDWPHCGCDPHADKVLGALSEEGWGTPPEMWDLRERVRTLEAEKADASETIESLLAEYSILQDAEEQEHRVSRSLRSITSAIEERLRSAEAKVRTLEGERDQAKEEQAGWVDFTLTSRTGVVIRYRIPYMVSQVIEQHAAKLRVYEEGLGHCESEAMEAEAKGERLMVSRSYFQLLRARAAAGEPGAEAKETTTARELRDHVEGWRDAD